MSSSHLNNRILKRSHYLGGWGNSEKRDLDNRVVSWGGFAFVGGNVKRLYANPAESQQHFTDDEPILTSAS